MGKKKQARLVERGCDSLRGGPCELWDVGGGRGVYVLCRMLAAGDLETVAFPVDMARRIVTDRNALGVWCGDATGGKAIRELGYEVVEDER